MQSTGFTKYTHKKNKQEVHACMHAHTVGQVWILFSKIDMSTKFKFTKNFHCIKNLLYRKFVACHRNFGPCIFGPGGAGAIA